MMLDGYVHLHRAPSEEGAPTLVLFHGTGGSKEDIAGLGQHLAPKAGLLAMDGDVSEFGARRFFRRTGEGVYDMEDLALRTAAMGRFLDGALAQYAVEQPIGLGYSNGANILANLMISGWAGVKRAVLMHPLIPFAPDWPDLSGVSVLVTAGERDPICPPALTRQLVEGLRGAGAEVAEHWHPGGHEITQDEVEAVRGWL
ncbi:alpha/beta hydrolase [Pontivivens ytuae]|uniref:Alpha/beta hydrolase n=2 Tax=Pontivivens ytuae TaxID=2789856 RepID=A0A7S9LSS3_9RHOB|nr:alpha/beta hydrolase [Pontivivens ytuae]